MRVSDIEEMVGRTSKLSGGTEYMELLEQIEDYWTDRAEGYSQVNQEELAGDNRTNWRRELESHFPENRTNETYKILDIGTGPGFFSIILAEAGYSVMAVDYTEAMLEEAKKNVRKSGIIITAISGLLVFLFIINMVSAIYGISDMLKQ